MSRKYNYNTVGRSNAEPSAAIPNDFCPVCKRVRYLNADMEFLINPECYHPMCANCVSNIFSKGPAQCPYVQCNKTLRQRGFRSAFFGDLTVEREVDVRRRVQAVFNMTQDDFTDLRAYNDYLQQVEDLTFDLVQGNENDRKTAEQQLLSYEQKHREEIEKNKRRGREAESQRKQRDAAEAAAARQRRLEEQREEERARAEEATINTEVMEALARGESGSAAEIQKRIVARKRARVAEISGSHFSTLLNTATSSSSTALNNTNTPSTNLLSIRGLRDKNILDDAEEYARRPYDPFAGLDLEPTRYTLHGQGDPETYPNPWLDDARKRDDHRVPGYSTREYVARALFEAFAGLGVVVGDEKADAQRGVGTVAAAEMAGAGAATAGGLSVKMEVDDVFG
ncbi:CDK-activating kinase assembly factor MAT1-domain-containing protein [Hypoxylon fragiforme]|uniref:CDK-activating kinase assembly factor MAT1-domain-containing protein n=1 Tax=Hypoxylon fragiforme TaxID=63214 RepID=UPI0020C70678|nr:CDK-activating kinase assembly factor MAT1-domain-containing protein [Hypoxylon fragiforme]KAI2604457.1 CDK-activating kinase assembly factor MAT1-domain-containing protein [Hypoxylon fragiforme]